MPSASKRRNNNRSNHKNQQRRGQKKTLQPNNKKRSAKEEATFDDDDDDDKVEDETLPRKRQQPHTQKQARKQPSSRKGRKDKDEDSDTDSGDSKEDSDKADLDKDEKVDEDDDDEQAQTKKGPAFSDENASWLKPKDKGTKKSDLLESDSDSDSDDDHDKDDQDADKKHAEDEDEDQEDDKDDDDDEELEIEKESRMIDEQAEEEAREAEEEMQRTVREDTSIYHLPTAEELEKDVDRVVPTSETRAHIESILEVLADFKTRREPGRARKEYMERLCGFMAELYGFIPELVEYFLTMFGPAECLEFIDASIQPRPLVIRTNTLKARRKDLAAALMKRGVSLDPLASWSKVGLKIVESPVPVGATPEYLGGWYMLQSAASMCPVLALDPQPKERVLDMAAAPGGKTSYMAQLMRNTGTIMANDLKKERQKATVANLHRLGVKNVIACIHDGRKLGSMFHNRFDRILLDAPCSGLGVMSRDPSVKVQRTVADVHQCAHLQKELLLSAIDALKCKHTTGGIMVYSTCSVSIAENEAVVQYALNKRDICILETGLDFGKPGFTRYQERRFHPSMERTRRFYPHVHNMDGFFVAKIQKLSDRRPEDTLDSTTTQAEEQQEEVQEEQVAQEQEEEKEVVTASNKGSNSGTKAVGKSKSKGQKRKRKADDENEGPTTTTKPSKKRDVSVPPRDKMATSKQRALQKKKKKTNAKVTKPRRSKPAIDV